MKRKLVKGLLIALAAALALGACAVALSHIVYGRSIKASLYEIVLRRRFANDRTPEEERARLEARLDEPEKAGAVPNMPMEARVETMRLGELDCFVLNGGAASDVTVVYLHGGAFINTFNYYHWHLMDRLAQRANCEIVAPDYHLTPYGDCARAYADLLPMYEAYVAAHPDRRIVLMGDSAGGGLALGLAEKLLAEGGPMPEQLILFSPWVDLTMENPDIADYAAVDPVLHLELVNVHAEMWANGLDLRDPTVSPLFGEMSGLPPVTLYAGTRELLYPDLERLAARLTDAGVETSFRVGRGLNHEYPLMPIPEAEIALREVVRLVAEGWR